jgi:hypothetical protein
MTKTKLFPGLRLVESPLLTKSVAHLFYLQQMNLWTGGGWNRHSGCEDRKVPDRAGCFVFLVRCSAAHAPSHVWPQVCTFMHPPAASCQRIGPVVLHTLWNHRENLWESFVMTLFVRSTVRSSVLVLKMRWSAATAAHKSWSPWLCNRDPSPPPPAPRCEATPFFNFNFFFPREWRWDLKKSNFRNTPIYRTKGASISRRCCKNPAKPANVSLFWLKIVPCPPSYEIITFDKKRIICSPWKQRNIRGREIWCREGTDQWKGRGPHLPSMSQACLLTFAASLMMIRRRESSALPRARVPLSSADTNAMSLEALTLPTWVGGANYSVSWIVSSPVCTFWTFQKTQSSGNKQRNLEDSVKLCPQLSRPATQHRQGLGPPPSNGIAGKRTTVYTQLVSNWPGSHSHRFHKPVSSNALTL